MKHSDKRIREGIARGLVNYGYSKALEPYVIDWISFETETDVKHFLYTYIFHNRNRSRLYHEILLTEAEGKGSLLNLPGIISLTKKNNTKKKYYVLSKLVDIKKNSMKLSDIRKAEDKYIECPLCGMPAERIQRNVMLKSTGINCPNCSTYYIDDAVFDEFDDAEHIYLLSGYTKHYWTGTGTYQFFTTAVIEDIIEKELRKDNDNRKIAELIHHYAQIETGDKWSLFENYPAIAYCKDIEDLKRVALLACENGYVEINDSMIRVTEQGVNFSTEVKRRMDIMKKPSKVFISHSSKDINYVKELVKLFEFIGLSAENMFCSSVPGYHIPAGQGDIYEYLRNEFNTFDLFMIYVLSPNYYDSAACLNEMGAAWVLKNQYQSILLPGMEFDDLDGAVDPRGIAIKLDSSDRQITIALINDLKELLIKQLDLKELNNNSWENHRNEFFRAVDEISERVEKEGSLKEEKPSFIDNSYYWGDDGPYCSRCYDADNKKIRLIKHDNGWGTEIWLCPVCKTEAKRAEVARPDFSSLYTRGKR